MDPVVEKGINHEKSLFQGFTGLVDSFNERCQDYLHNLLNLGSLEEEAEKEEEVAEGEEE